MRAINSGRRGWRARGRNACWGQFVEARWARAITFPKPLVRRATESPGTTIQRHSAPFARVTNAAQRRSSRPPPIRLLHHPLPASLRHLVPPDPLRRPNNPIRLFPARMYAYTEVCNFGVGNARHPDERPVRACIAYSRVRTAFAEANLCLSSG